jgi:transposase-like protein
MKRDDLVLNLLVPDEDRAVEIFRQIRWSNGVYCPKCKSFDIYNRGIQGKTRRYSCNECGANFSDLTDSIFANKKLPVGEMLYILINLDKKSVKRLSEELGHKWESINRLAKEFRGNLAEMSEDPILQGEIEIDEMYYSAGSKGLKKRTPDIEDLN